MILVHAHRDRRIKLDQTIDQILQDNVVGVAARATASLDNHRSIDLFGRFHDGQALLHVVNVEGGQAVVVFGGVIEQLSKRNAGHIFPLSVLDLKRGHARQRLAFHPL